MNSVSYSRHNLVEEDGIIMKNTGKRIFYAALFVVLSILPFLVAASSPASSR